MAKGQVSREEPDLSSEHFPGKSSFVSQYDSLGPTTSSTPGPGYLGSTSFSAVYQEEKGLDGLPYNVRVKSLANPGKVQRLYLPNRDSQVRKGMTCLALLINYPEFAPMLHQWQQLYGFHNIIFPFTLAIDNAVKISIYGTIADAEGAELEQLLVQKIFRNLPE